MQIVNFPFRLNIKSEGGILVVVWGQLFTKDLHISRFQSFLSRKAVWETLFINDINLSTWTFAWGHIGLVLWYLMLLAAKYPWSSYDVKGEPMSDTMLFDMPYELKNCSSAKITFLAGVLLINSTPGDFLRWSIITNIPWPFMNRPQKSRLMVSNVSDGVGCGINLCRSCDGLTDLQEVQRFNTCPAWASLNGM